MIQGFDRIGKSISAASADRCCLKKRAFNTRTEARDHAKRGEKNHGNAPQQSYKCPVCGKFHLTRIEKEYHAATRQAIRRMK